MRNSITFSTWLRITVMFMVTILTSAVTAQTGNQLLKVANWGYTSLDTEQQGKVSSLQQQSGVLSLQYVEVADIAIIQQNGWLDLTMPDKECTAKVKAKHVETSINGDYYWYGSVIKQDGITQEACSCYDGTINLIYSGGRFAGTFKIDEDFYELHDLGTGKRILLKKDYTGLSKHCDTEDIEEDALIEEGLVEDRNNGNCPVRVLVLTTAAARAALPDINSAINLTIQQTNQALRNSLVSEEDLKLVLVGINTVTFTESSNIRTDLNALISNTELQTRRNNADADIVLVFVEGNYGNVIGRAGTLTLQPERAVAVVKATDALFNFTTSHELAHLFGCRHEPEADPTGPIEHAHAFPTGCWPFRKDRNTIMFSIASGNTIQHYSNPNVNYKGKKTGVAGERENWRKIRNNACTVANFRNLTTPPLNAYIAGSLYGCLCSWTTASAVASGGAPGLYSFQWHTSTDGFNWGVLQSIDSEYNVELPCEEGEGVYVRLTVTSIDGQSVQIFRFFEAASTWPGQEGPCSRSLSESNQIQESISVSPNPVNDICLIKGTLNVENDVLIDLYDNTGRLLSSMHHSLPLGKFEKNINLDNLPNGLYALRIRVDGKVTTTKLVKQ